MKNFFKVVITFCSFISCLLVLLNLYYLSLIISLLSFILCFIFLKKERRLFLINIFICICSIITNVLILSNNYKKDIDILKDKNILVGDWLYNDINGKYIFNDDYSYYQYISSNRTDNYCYGEYNYSYGGIDNSGMVIKNDGNYYYYTLVLNTNYCIINGIRDDKITKSEFVFSVNVNDYEDLLFMDKVNNKAFKLTKIN